MTEPIYPAPDDTGAGDAVVEQNIQRLLTQSYRPEQPDADFARRVRQKMLAAAADRSPRRRWTARVLAWSAAAAAVLAVGIILGYAIRRPDRPDRVARVPDGGTTTSPAATQPRDARQE